ncbi:hydroxymethylbilane synthase [Enterococcus casseliflavus]|uniref:hydroxymethylbilane synthase n=1 Tax=Enterococcus casseliflavus TaxID=37734 RepID=UPI001330625C|nr:hydroxymethylbilane synthase [Enterococcus casseliflavus]
MKTIKVGTRASKLALTQTKQALIAIQQRSETNLKFEIVKITTKGDRLKNHSLQSIGGQGAFVKELEHRLLDKTIDLAVHSLKDMPTDIPEELTIGGVLPRENPYDCLVFAEEGNSLTDLAPKAIVGTSSLRRQAQLLRMRPDLTIRPIRGNIDTRISKLHTEYDAIVLAMAGIKRLSLDKTLYLEQLSEKHCVPAIGQGALSLECRKEDRQLKEMLERISDRPTLLAITAEREFLRRMDSSCTYPIGGFAKFDNGQLRLTGMVGKADGSVLLKQQLIGKDPVILGRQMAQDLKDQGADQLIEEYR